jgi:hypothetical protein
MRAVARLPPAQQQNGAQRGGDDEQGNGGCQRSQGINDGRRHGGGLALQLQRQGIQVTGGLTGSGDFAPGQRKSKQADAGRSAS